MILMGDFNMLMHFISPESLLNELALFEANTTGKYNAISWI